MSAKTEPETVLRLMRHLHPVLEATENKDALAFQKGMAEYSEELEEALRLERVQAITQTLEWVWGNDIQGGQGSLALPLRRCLKALGEEEVEVRSQTFN